MRLRFQLALLLALSGCYAHGWPFDNKRMCGAAYPMTPEECAQLRTPPAPPVEDAGTETATPDAATPDAATPDAQPPDAQLADAQVPDAAPAAAPCRRKSRPSPREPDDIEVGCTEAQVIAAEGKPVKREGSVWIYLYPRGCSDWRVTVRATFSKGRVVKVTRDRKYTGELCMDVF